MSCKCCFSRLISNYEDCGEDTFNYIEVPNSITHNGLYKMDYSCDYDGDETFTIKEVDNG